MPFDAKRNLLDHPPSPETQTMMETVRAFAISYAFSLGRCLVDSPEKSLALTKLEESVQWAIAGLARADYDFQELQKRLSGATADANADAGLDHK